MILNIHRIGGIIFKTFFFVILIFVQQLFPQSNFTIIGIPDTQSLVDVDETEPYHLIFDSQTEWIVAKKDSLNIVYVAHFGDIVQHADEDVEWEYANISMSFLEDPITTNLTDGIPYGTAVGNHDQDGWGDPDGTQMFNVHFGVSRFENRNYYGGHYGSDNDNHYDFFSASGIDFIAIYIEYDSDQQQDAPEIIWAEGILQAYSNRRAIIVSHRIIDEGNPAPFKDGQGEALYNAFKVYPNVFLMLCGHVKGEGQREDTYQDNTIHTLLADYQGSHDGNLRIMEFDPVLNKIDVYTYSPWLNEFDTGTSSQFTIYTDFSALPVELAFFTGSLNGGNIDLRWRTETEVNNYGFEIERTKDNSDWLTISFVEGHGNSNSPKQYYFIDTDIDQSGTYYYRLKQIDNDGTYEYFDVESVEVGVPDNFYLSQNYPNPFNPETRIDYTLPEKQFVSLRIYSTLGELVAELVNEFKEAGSYSVTFDTSNLPSGVYIYRLQTLEFAENKKMTLLK
jgi:hypothetical protein